MASLFLATSGNGDAFGIEIQLKAYKVIEHSIGVEQQQLLGVGLFNVSGCHWVKQSQHIEKIDPSKIQLGKLLEWRLGCYDIQIMELGCEAYKGIGWIGSFRIVDGLI